MSRDPNAAGLAINWHVFGSNGLETADYSRGVLERFTRRASKDCGSNHILKVIVNPRKTEAHEIHTSNYFAGFYSVSENGDKIKGFKSPFVSDAKVVINHYHCKSWEEYALKNSRGDGVFARGGKYNRNVFNAHNRNEEFDDSILHYRDARAKVYQPPEENKIIERLLVALERNLSPTLSPDTPGNFYVGKLETFLTCLTTISWLKNKLQDKTKVILFEEELIKAIVHTLSSELTFREKILFIRALPKLLELPYPALKDLRIAGLQLLPTLKENFSSKIQELSFRVVTKTLMGDLSQAEKMSFIKELSEILEISSLTIKDMRIAELQFTQKFTNDFASKRMWRGHLQAWKDYFEMNYIHDILNLK